MCVCVCWYFDVALVRCMKVSKTPWGSVPLGTTLRSRHDGETRHWGGYSTGQQLEERLHKHAAPTGPASESFEIHTTSHISKPKLNLMHTSTQNCTQCCVHPEKHTQTLTCFVLTNSPIAERTARWLARRKHYTSTFRHMARRPTDGHTHMVLVASAASHALCSPLIRLQIPEQSTQSTA